MTSILAKKPERPRTDQDSILPEIKTELISLKSDFIESVNGKLDIPLKESWEAKTNEVKEWMEEKYGKNRTH